MKKGWQCGNECWQMIYFLICFTNKVTLFSNTSVPSFQQSVLHCSELRFGGYKDDKEQVLEIALSKSQRERSFSYMKPSVNTLPTVHSTYLDLI